jgi:polysaccharide export outer membrane protein
MHSIRSSLLASCAVLLTLAVLVGCAQFPTSGPSTVAIQQAAAAPGTAVVQIVELDDRIARELREQRRPKLFSDTLGETRPQATTIGRGDALEVSIWEAPPATLFGGGPVDPRLPSSVRATVMPEQVVGDDGFISVPFAGRIVARGQTLQALEAEIVRRLRGKANQPEVVVRLLRNVSSTVTVVGEVTNSLRMPLTPGGERLLDALAAAGGVRQPVNKTTVQVTRDKDFHAMPLDMVIRDPRQNVPLQPGDVVTAMFQPLSFTALGATGRNEEINFETQGITLAQALARVGGLIDTRSSPQGVFVFRFEPQQALAWPQQPVATTADGLVPVVYRIDLRNPNSFFVMQSFPISNKDVLYVSNAPAAELQKFLNVIFSIAYPVLTAVQVGR